MAILLQQDFYFQKPGHLKKKLYYFEALWRSQHSYRNYFFGIFLWIIHIPGHAFKFWTNKTKTIDIDATSSK